ncbi:MAG: hypothetical protein IJX03_08290 [Clostridia bacterium]|nr:hypothetical protein [Clostridia bacterium]
MIYAARYENELRVWWDERNDKTQGMKYRIYVDGRTCVYTERVYYNFKNLESGREYEFEIQLVDKYKNVVGKSEKQKFSTLNTRRVVDITKPPYNAVGDGISDNTEIFKKALSELSKNEKLYIPMGVYICDNISFTGDVSVHFDVGAILCSKEKGFSL